MTSPSSERIFKGNSNNSLFSQYLHFVRNPHDVASRTRTRMASSEEHPFYVRVYVDGVER